VVEEISSFSNPLIKRIKRLRQKKYRRRESAFFVEGLRVILTAVESGAAIETLVYCPELLTSEVAWKLVRRPEEDGIRRQAVSAEIFASISERENPVGLAAIIRTQWTALEELAVAVDDIVVALYQTSEPGNLGTILRTMDAVGARNAVLVGDTVDPFHPSAVRASMGALFTVNIAQVSDCDQLLSWAREKGVATVASSAKATTVYTEANYVLPVLLFLGNEGEGLPRPVIEACDLAVTIPMAGQASSLNLAVAAGLLLYAIRRTQAL
jgi:RNA methyltransferase, TrmH family